jgi:hypothetical protein
MKNIINKLYIKTSYERILEIERNTREQSDCDVWYSERSKILTTSNFGSVIKCRKNNHPKSLLKKNT